MKNTITKPLLLSVALPVLFCVLPALGQSYSIPSFTIDGGGGSCSGGRYQVQGTLGQPDTQTVVTHLAVLQSPGDLSGAAAISDPSYSLAGGFWPGAVKPPVPPRLGIRHEGLTSVILSWPVSSVPYILKATTNVAIPRGWTEVIGETVIVGDNKEMTLRTTGQTRLFRLEINKP